MPRKKQTPEQQAAMRERILDAAHQQLLEHGPASLSIRSIAARLDVSHMVLYTYFENRDTLVAALRERQRSRLRTRQAEMVRRAEEGDVAGAMRDTLASYIHFAHARPQPYRLLWATPLSHGAIADPRPEECDCPNPNACHHHRMSAHLQHLERLVTIGISRGVFAERDPQEAAAMVFSIVNGPLILYHSGHLTSEDLRDRLTADALDLAMAYLTANPTRIEEYDFTCRTSAAS